MDISSLAVVVQSLYWLGISPATYKTYGATLKKFQTFCSQYNILSPFPPSQDILCSFTADLNRQNTYISSFSEGLPIYPQILPGGLTST